MDLNTLRKASKVGSIKKKDGEFDSDSDDGVEPEADPIILSVYEFVTEPSSNIFSSIKPWESDKSKILRAKWVLIKLIIFVARKIRAFWDTLLNFLIMVKTTMDGRYNPMKFRFRKPLKKPCQCY